MPTHPWQAIPRRGRSLAPVPLPIAYLACGGLDGHVVCAGEQSPGTGVVDDVYSYDPADDTCFLEVSCTFLAEVHSGDTLYPALTITGLEPTGDTGIVVTAATIHNQRGQLVLSGQHKYLLRRQ
ncbi:hypothetical protein ACFZDK_51745 [Streptomyces sp. NPDC007901]|uniref:hypothetical protein n=1 Tax=Streptomyces sp. NPDC007901 TaxID=3364785 RepID=UPI0036E4711E